MARGNDLSRCSGPLGWVAVTDACVENTGEKGPPSRAPQRAGVPTGARRRAETNPRRTGRRDRAASRGADMDLTSRVFTFEIRGKFSFRFLT